MTFTLVKPGSMIAETYFAVPEGSTIGPKFPGWDEAVRYAQNRRSTLIEQLTESMAGYATKDYITKTADVQVVIDLRWVIYQPDGSKLDTVIERFTEVAKLRTRAEVDGRAE